VRALVGSCQAGTVVHDDDDDDDDDDMGLFLLMTPLSVGQAAEADMLPSSYGTI
jgi:hypothetical protein